MASDRELSILRIYCEHTRSGHWQLPMYILNHKTTTNKKHIMKHMTLSIKSPIPVLVRLLQHSNRFPLVLYFTPLPVPGHPGPIESLHRVGPIMKKFSESHKK